MQSSSSNHITSMAKNYIKRDMFLLLFVGKIQPNKWFLSHQKFIKNEQRIRTKVTWLETWLPDTEHCTKNWSYLNLARNSFWICLARMDWEICLFNGSDSSLSRTGMRMAIGKAQSAKTCGWHRWIAGDRLQDTSAVSPSSIMGSLKYIIRQT